MPSAEEINLAIRECLEQCYVSKHPLACLADHLRNLRQRPNWNDAAISQVEQKALRMLTILLEPPAETPAEAE